ncbi:DUF2569 family protein [Herbaspirillum chlorophenolicum]|uniref:DUF2569 family protein n=1 Tax=Herbaspirillum chlorophenolicum TaxID=211589 RepID=A0ABW8EY01_9BURK
MNGIQEDEKNPLGGWFILTVIVVLIVWPIAGFAMFHSRMVGAEAYFSELTRRSGYVFLSLSIWWMFLITSALQVIAGWRLIYHRRWSSIRFALFAIWIAGPGFVVVKFLSFAWSMGTLITVDRAMFVSQLLVAAIIAGVWTWYLLKSDRVRTWYGALR